MLYEKLDYVLAIAEEQNLTRAAKKLYISQPTLTMYLNRLEENLGVKLFDRRKNPITITPAGRRYIEKMTEISEKCPESCTDLSHRFFPCKGALLASTFITDFVKTTS